MVNRLATGERGKRTDGVTGCDYYGKVDNDVMRQQGMSYSKRRWDSGPVDSCHV
jgi:hypothetical protein